jgi:non-specific serine/threonine protein kinase/serine/threonine-protein kinase
MQAERWREIDDIFQAVLDCEPGKRTTLIESSCGSNPELRKEVESLLAAYQRAQFTLTSVLQEGMKVLDQEASAQDMGRRIGPYRLLREIGRGGMGSVYLAARADEAYQKFVAIKLIRRGLDTDDIVRCFRSERQILASLDHPNIARLLDAGSTDDGLPYFVMEYIEGEPIDKYCDVRSLNITERLKLFQGVCAAVRYAHQNLVIHRDIKPGNVLVTKEGVPRLLDFGIAKLLAPGIAADETLTRVHPFTPEYASPEQIRGEVITTASDVYSLGVLLYVLLTGISPYHASMSSPSEIERTICEEEPERPSAVVLRGPATASSKYPAQKFVTTNREGTPERLHRRLSGDLDNIALMALRKEPSRRYASVEQCSEDITRHLADLPVIARPDTPGYRATKFIARHRTGVATTALVILVLMAGIIGTSWQARVARAERARAQQQFDDVRKLATSFLFEFNNSIQNLPGATPARKLLVQRALAYLSKLSQQSRGDRGLQRDLAEAYLKVGDLQGNPYEPNLGDVAGAEASYQKALAISSSLVTADPRDSPAKRYLARSYQSIGEVLPLMGKASDGANNLRQATQIFQSLLDASPHDRDLRVQTANCYQSLADLLGHGDLQNLGDRAGAVENYRKSLAIFDAMAADDSKDLKARSGAAVLRIRVGDMLQAQSDLEAAIEYYRAALPRAESIVAADPKNERFLRVLALSCRKLADAESQKGDLKQALTYAQQASGINQQMANADPDNTQAQANFALSLTTAAGLLSKTSDLTGALEKYRQAAAIIEKLSAVAPSDLFARGQLGEALISLGSALDATGHTSEARDSTSRGLSIERELASRAGSTADELSRYALALLTCEPVNLRQPAAALQFARQAAEKSGDKDVKSLDILAQAYFRNSNPRQAMETEEKILNLVPAPLNGSESPARKHADAQLALFKKAPYKQ